jgi:hypothetical protein
MKRCPAGRGWLRLRREGHRLLVCVPEPIRPAVGFIRRSANRCRGMDFPLPSWRVFIRNGFGLVAARVRKGAAARWIRCVSDGNDERLNSTASRQLNRKPTSRRGGAIWRLRRRHVSGARRRGHEPIGMLRDNRRTDPATSVNVPQVGRSSRSVLSDVSVSNHLSLFSERVLTVKNQTKESVDASMAQIN